MQLQTLQYRLTLYGPASYAIWIQGALDASWEPELGMQIAQSEQEFGIVTCLTGCLRDQAALAGVLHRLYGLGYPLIQVSLVAGMPTQAATK